MMYPTHSRYIPTSTVDFYKILPKMDSEEFALMVLNRSEIREYPHIGEKKFCPFLNIERHGIGTVFCSFLIEIRDLSVIFNTSLEEFRDNNETGFFFRIEKELPRGLKRLHAKGKLIPLLKAHMML